MKAFYRSCDFVPAAARDDVARVPSRSHPVRTTDISDPLAYEQVAFDIDMMPTRRHGVAGGPPDGSRTDAGVSLRSVRPPSGQPPRRPS